MIETDSKSLNSLSTTQSTGSASGTGHSRKSSDTSSQVCLFFWFLSPELWISIRIEIDKMLDSNSFPKFMKIFLIEK